MFIAQCHECALSIAFCSVDVYCYRQPLKKALLRLNVGTLVHQIDSFSQHSCASMYVIACVASGCVRGSEWSVLVALEPSSIFFRAHCSSIVLSTGTFFSTLDAVWSVRAISSFLIDACFSLLHRPIKLQVEVLT